MTQAKMYTVTCIKNFLYVVFRVDPKNTRILAQLISAYSKFDPAKAQRFVVIINSSFQTKIISAYNQRQASIAQMVE